MKEEALAEELGALVRRLRLERGYSRAGFAEACRSECSHMGQIERGETVINVRTALRIARGLGMNLSFLFVELEKGSNAPYNG